LEFFAEAEGHTPTARLALLLRVKAEVTPIRAISMPFQRWSRQFHAISTLIRAISTLIRAISTLIRAISTLIRAISTLISQVEREYHTGLLEQGIDPTTKPLAGDEILPIFVFLVASAATPSLRAVGGYLAAVSSPSLGLFKRYCNAVLTPLQRVGGESGYYLCVLEAAVSHILSMEMDDVELVAATRQQELPAASPTAAKLPLESYSPLDPASLPPAVQVISRECVICATPAWPGVDLGYTAPLGSRWVPVSKRLVGHQGATLTFFEAPHLAVR